MFVASETRATILSGPINSLALAGDTARLSCLSNSNRSTLIWERQLLGSSRYEDFYTGSSFVRKYSDKRYTVEAPGGEEGGSQRSTLVMTAVRLGEAGRYRCVVSVSDTAASAELVVMGSYMYI